ncbi:MAG: LysM peptidoglycan-binding domain-containing protein [Clostridiales bacterium]|jgi:LysM repeat protein|nr:LysM peptidoglycan-binding domain-containing protein [Clostridiales bacterium]MDR2751119.1 LysM peptidoglycan-binding domain-containing protein [Clostridiales bacterium]
MEHFELPANIKQIGSIGEGVRIYIEDTVCSYLYELGADGGNQDRVALLAGKYMVIDSQPILFIGGAIQARHTEVQNGLEVFTEKSMDYAEEMLDKHFPSMKIAGWMLSQPSYGSGVTSGVVEAHLETFKKKYQVLFVMDPIERTNAFYTYTKSGMALEEAKGYFIYYDKNEGMRGYIEDCRDEPKPAPIAEARPTARPAAPDTLSRARTASRSVQKDSSEQKRILNLLVGLSAVLFIVSFIMGAGLIQNQDRISSLERQVAVINATYSPTSVTETGSKDTIAPAYAASSDAMATGEPKDAVEDAVGASDEPGEVAAKPDPTVEPVPEPTPEPTPTLAPMISERPDSYTVKAGDTLISISVKFYGTAEMVQRIMDYNGIEDPNTIFSGKTIQLPEE